jgi:hypothetical protein
MLINLLKFSNDYCFLNYSLTKENLELLGVKHWLYKLYKSYNNKEFKKIFGSDYFSKHIKVVEITNKNINNENFENGFKASNLIFVFFMRGIYYAIEFCFNRKKIFTIILKVFW